MPLAYWVDNLNPFLIRFSENFGIRYYGLAYAAGFLAAYLLLLRYSQTGRSLLSPQASGDLITSVIIGVVVGGRLGYFLFYDGLRTLFADPLAIFRVWDGGMASHGGMIGVALMLAWFARSHKVPFLHLGDLIVSTAPAGLFFGRIANFINGELWGKYSLVPWAVIFPKSAPNTPVEHIMPRHPSQLYEAGLEGAFLFAYLQWRFWKSDAVRDRPGRLGGEFLVLYALVRIFCEIFREPDEGVAPIFGLSRGTFYSLFLIAAGLFLIFRRSRPLTRNA